MEAESNTLYTPPFPYVPVPVPQKPQRGRTEAGLGTAMLFSNNLWDCFSSPAQRCLEELSHHDFEFCFSLLLWVSGLYMTAPLSHSSLEQAIWGGVGLCSQPEPQPCCTFQSLCGKELRDRQSQCVSSGVQKPALDKEKDCWDHDTSFKSKC